MENNALGRLLSVFVAPAKTFRSIAERPTWLLALLATAAASVLLMVVAVPKIDWEAEVRSGLAQRSIELSDEEIAEQVEIAEKVGAGATYGAAVVMPLLFIPFTALLFWGILRLLGGQLGFAHALAVTTHGYLPGTLKALLALPILAGLREVSTQALQNGDYLMSNLGFLAGVDGGAVQKALLSSVDVFSVWSIVLLVIGFAVVGKVSRGTAAIGVGGLWLVGIAIKAGLALVGQIFG